MRFGDGAAVMQNERISKQMLNKCLHLLNGAIALNEVPFHVIVI